MADTRIAAIDAPTTIVGFLCRCVGVAFALLAAAVNPLVCRLWQPQWLDHADVNFEFACWALGCGCALCLISMRPPRSEGGAVIFLGADYAHLPSAHRSRSTRHLGSVALDHGMPDCTTGTGPPSGTLSQV